MDSVPEPYLDAWARLQVHKPAVVSDAGWQQVVDDAGGFLDQWGKLAAELGWTAGDLFDVPRIDGACGLAWWLRGRTVTARLAMTMRWPESPPMTYVARSALAVKSLANDPHQGR
jgi:hypothetical protein